MSIQRVRRAWRYLTRNGDLQDQLSKTKLISDGETIYSISTVTSVITFSLLKSNYE